MKMQFKDSHQDNNTTINALFEANKYTQLSFDTKLEKINWVKQFLNKVQYKKIKRKILKTKIKAIIASYTGQSDRTIDLWIHKYKHGHLKQKIYKRYVFSRKYTFEDTILLTKVDSVTERISASSLCNLFKREFNIYHKEEFKRLSNISKSQINNLRLTNTYKRRARVFEKTHSTKSHFLPIGKMEAKGVPGYLRVDTVHSGERNEVKGLYYVNMIDDVLQTEYLFTVPVISEKYMKIILDLLISSYWTPILAFHSDGGSEYNNSIVVSLLNKLHIKDQTRSRPYHCNDNALIEMKNGYIIRKHFGFLYIPKDMSDKFNIYLNTYFNQYLNFHRSCGYLTGEHKSKKGRTVREYGYYNTPYETFKEKYIEYLKPGLTIANLDKIAYAQSDYESAQDMAKYKKELFKEIFSTIANYETTTT
ncbi:MAG: integrase catalytic domain-containing protein [Acidiferrobacterales bacterium]